MKRMFYLSPAKSITGIVSCVMVACLAMISYSGFSQCVMTIDGAATITVPSGTFVGTQGNVTFQDVTSSGLGGSIDNSGTVECQGTWTNNAPSGGLINGSPGTVLLDGASQTITGTTPTTF